MKTTMLSHYPLFSRGIMWIQQRALLLAQIGWIIIALFAVTLTVMGIPAHYAAVQHVGTTNEQLHSFLQLSQQDATALQHFGLGLSLSIYAWFILFADTQLALVFFGVAIFLFLIKRNDGMTLFVSLLFLLFAGTQLGFTQVPLTSHTILALPVAFFQMIETIWCLLFLYLFPDGRWVPAWTRFCAFGWILLNGLWLVLPNFPFNPIYAKTWFASFGLSFTFTLLWFISGFYAQFWRLRFGADTVVQRQTRWVLFGMIGVFIGALLIYFPPVLSLPHIDRGLFIAYRLIGIPLAYFFVGLLPLCLSASILRHQLWDIDIFNRVILRSLMLGILAWLYFWAIALLQSVSFTFLGNVNGTVLNILINILVTGSIGVLFWLGNYHLQRFIIFYYTRDTIDTEQLQQLTLDLYTAADLTHLLTTFARRTANVIQSTHSRIFLRTADQQFLLASMYPQAGVFSSSTSLPCTDKDIAILARNTPLYDQNNLQATLLLPLMGLRQEENALEGILVLGPRSGRLTYTHEDRRLLLKFAKAGGLALSVVRLLHQNNRDQFREIAHDQIEQLVWAGPATLSDMHTIAQAPGALQIFSHTQLEMRGSMLETLSQGFSRLLENNSLQEIRRGIELILSALTVDPIDKWAGSRDALAFYRRCDEALHLTESLEFLLPTTTESPAIDQTPHEIAAQETLTWLHLTCDFDKLARIRQQVIAALMVQAIDERVIAFTHILTHLTDFIQHELPLIELPERLIFLRIGEQWSAIVHEALEQVQARPELRVRLLTRRVHPPLLSSPTTTLTLEITNHGRADAPNLQVELLPDPAYLIKQQPKPLASLPRGATHFCTCTVQIRPDVEVIMAFRITYTDADTTPGHTHSQRILTFQESISVQKARTFVPFSNPYIMGRPIEMDCSVFFGRAALLTTLHEVLCNPAVIVITGHHRVGKTSLVQQLPRHLPPDWGFAYIDFQLLLDPGVPSFFLTIATGICRALGRPLPHHDMFLMHPDLTFRDEFLPSLFTHIAKQHLVVAFDEFEILQARVHANMLPPTIFGYLRSLLQHERRLSFLFVGAHRFDELLDGQLAHVFDMAQHYRLDLLPETEAQALIEEPVQQFLSYDDEAISRMIAVTAGHPYFLQILCTLIVDEARVAQRTWVTQEHITSALPLVLERADAHFGDVWHALSANEKMVLIAVSHFLPLASPTTLEDICFACERQRFALDRQAVMNALRTLVAHDILAVTKELEEEVTAVYQWKVWLYGYWVKNRPRMV